MVLPNPSASLCSFAYCFIDSSDSIIALLINCFISDSSVRIDFGIFENFFFIPSITSFDATSPAFMPPIPSAMTRSAPLSESSTSSSVPTILSIGAPKFVKSGQTHKLSWLGELGRPALSVFAAKLNIILLIF